mmetsp:Transcript_125734/g.250921  ORF Transcript_125734/g.250921 Transcript_125734/m.250921 type:complete len:86 (+) Transcript_125734:480-737(+)
MEGIFSFSEAPEEYLDFLQEKRRQVFSVSSASGLVGALAAVLLAAIRGQIVEAVPAVQTILAASAALILVLVAYGVVAGGLRRGV